MSENLPEDFPPEEIEARAGHFRKIIGNYGVRFLEEKAYRHHLGFTPDKLAKAADDVLKEAAKQERQGIWSTPSLEPTVLMSRIAGLMPNNAANDLPISHA